MARTQAATHQGGDAPLRCLACCMQWRAAAAAMVASDTDLDCPEAMEPAGLWLAGTRARRASGASAKAHTRAAAPPASRVWSPDDLATSPRVLTAARAKMLARSLRPLVAQLAPFAASTRALSTSAAASKASEPAFEHTENEECAFQTKIFEVLQMKKEDGGKLWVSDECMVLDAVKKMAANDVGSLLVYDKTRLGSGGEVPTSVDACVGIITERDYLKKIIVRGLASATTPVASIMTPADKLAVLTPQHSVLEAMDLMVRYNVRHVPVMDNNAMTGVLSMKDVVKVLLDDQKHEIDSLKDYIHGGW